MDQNPFRSAHTPLEEAAFQLAERIRDITPHPAYTQTPRALLVGGFVRDTLLGNTSKDIDIEVYGVAPDVLERVLQELYPHRVLTVGRSFGILKISFGEDGDLDIAIPRRESKTGPGHKGFVVTGDPNMSIEDAARRRDFTINAIAMDPLTGDVIDPFHGREDLERRILRAVDPETFVEDPLRVYRALQFTARLELHVDDATFALMHDMVTRGDLAELPAERVTDELKKLLLKATRPSLGLTLAKELGIIAASFPELEALIGTEQEPEWHPEGDVWIHTLLVVDRAAQIIREPARAFSDDEKIDVMVGALCHDLGKPPTTQIIDGRIRSRGHEEAGVEPTRTLLARLTFGESVERAALAATKEHLKPGMLHLELQKGTLTPDAYANAVRKLLKRTYPVSWRVFLAIAEADYRGRDVPDARQESYPHGDLFARTVQTQHLDEEPPKPLLLGRDLIELGIEPGPRMGEIIAEVETLRDEGAIKTREEALAEARRIIAGN